MIANKKTVASLGVYPQGLKNRSQATRSPVIYGILIHWLRVGFFVAIVGLIYLQHRSYQAQLAGEKTENVTLQQLQEFFPQAVNISQWDPAHGGRYLFDGAGRTLGYFVLTSPKSDSVVGYSGPSNMLLALDDEGRAIGFRILSSRDTVEHVTDVQGSQRFMQMFNGKTWSEIAESEHVDGVSGATLTSLAVAEAIRYRLGGTKPSYRFPQPVTIAEVRNFFPAAKQLQPDQRASDLLHVLDADGLPLGSVLRSSPTADNVIGYQGPTDILMAVEKATQTILGMALRHSYDNQPYVDYVRDDRSFQSRFNGMTIRELAELDIEQAEIEGTSGATMTSMAVALGMVRAAKQAISQQAAKSETGHKRRIVFQLRDAGTIAVLLLALLMAFTRLRSFGPLRLAQRVLLVVYLGFLNGDMLSQALLVGWAQSGVPWRLAPGLVILSVAALMVPVLTRRQLYCHHVCPYGAAQQIIKRRLPWRWKLSLPVVRCLQVIPLVLLLIIVLAAMSGHAWNLAALEPFDAFLFWIAGGASIAIAIGGLLVSAFVPMAYCRFGCPTGAVLSFLRRSSRSDKLTIRDAAAALLLIVALIMWMAV